MAVFKISKKLSDWLHLQVASSSDLSPKIAFEAFLCSLHFKKL